MIDVILDRVNRNSALVLAFAFGLVACSRSSSSPTDPAAPLTPATSSAAPSASVSASAVVEASAPILTKSDASATAGGDDSDFEDQFAYGTVDSGAGDPAKLAKPPTYKPYTNGRFGFSLDVPDALTAMPAPDNGDGLQWRLGHLVAMTASGMNFLPELGSPMCASSKNVVSRQGSKTGCFATGKKGGYIFWEKHVIARDIDFSLRFQYAESLKTAMDAIVTHVNASWSH